MLFTHLALSLAIIDSFVKLREISRNIAALHQEQDKEKQKSLVQRTGELLNDLLLDDGETTETESTVEINLVALKFKHTVKMYHIMCLCNLKHRREITYKNTVHNVL